MTPIKAKRWSSSELKRLAASYRAGGWRAAVAEFGGRRTKQAIQTKATQLGLVSRGRWTPDDLHIATRMADDFHDVRSIARALGRSEKSVELAFRRKGIAHEATVGVDDVVAEAVAESLLNSVDANGTVSAVATKLNVGYREALELVRGQRGVRRHITPWGEDEKAFLREHYATASFAWIVARLNETVRRTPSAIRIMASTLGLTADRRTAALRGLTERTSRASGADGD